MKVEQQIEYEASSDAEAIRVARDRLGREAVILSSRPVKRGGFFGLFRRNALWVTAGVLVPDHDDIAKESRERMVAFQHLLEVRRAVEGVVPPERPARESGTASAFSNPAVTPVQSAKQAYEANSVPVDAGPTAREVDEIKEILSRVLSRLEDDGVPSQARDIPIDENVKKLLDADVDRDIADSVVTKFKASDSRAPFEKWLPTAINTLGTDPASAMGGKKILFAGSTGVGKTTTIAKIAAMQSLWGNKKVVLMTADTYRIAAVEQLRTYAKILGIPIEIIADQKDMPGILKKHREADLILMDTAGRSHYDDGRIEELRSLYETFSPDAAHLVVAANMKYRDMLSVIDRMGVVPISALLFTKLDETSTYGTMFNAMWDFGLPVSFFTVGQNVPNDIEVARSERFVDLLYGGTPVQGGQS
ncbi:MAG: flagellar biosynthesis protein FlhF [Synergistaceae bacterium]|jgi:flagellar biosynthesis protein FlhF|nr:flagellar biosynthesis protein FlhF [Synergistaceae bacterium]